MVLLEGDQFITAGEDGYIRWWSFTDVDNAESDEIPEVEIKPVQELLVETETHEPAYIITMLKGEDHWLLGDARGRIWRMEADTLKY